MYKLSGLNISEKVLFLDKAGIQVSIYINQVVISACLLFVCTIITQESLDRFSSNFDWGTRANHRHVLCLALRF